MFYIARIIIVIKYTSLALLIGICCNNAYALCITDTNTAIWYGGFGTAANQKTTNFSHAYRATSDGLEHTYIDILSGINAEDSREQALGKFLFPRRA